MQPCLQEALKGPRRGPQEAPKRPSRCQNLRMVLTVSSFFGVDDFWHTLQRFRLLPLQDACLGPRKSCFSYMFPMVSAHGHVGLFGRTSEAAFLCLLFAPLPLLRIFDRVMLEPRSCIQKLRKSLRWVAKNEALLRKLCRTLGPKSSRASGWHAKRPNMQFLLCFTGQTGPRAQKP